ncbi:M14 family zinc carboxypeptidase [bacterium]
MKKSYVVMAILFITIPVTAQVQSPEDFFGFKMGTDYKLAGWNEIVTYFQLIEAQSDRIQVMELGRSTEDNPFIMTVISSPENLARLDEIRNTSKRLSTARGLSPEQARTIAREGKILVLITCSLHATEVGAAQATPELVYGLITEDNPSNREVLNNVVFLLVPSFNPDGLIMVKEWYDQYLETEFEGSSMPWLYQLYTGHDNNRDAFMLTQVESRLVNRVLYHEWFPQIYLDMHQMGNSGSRIFIPPFIDPLNPNTDPLIVWELAILGNEMALGLETQGKTGVGTSHSFTGWWEGAFLMNAWWHNTVGLLTELASCKIATPIFQNKNDLRGGRRGIPKYDKLINFPNPWPGGWWRLRDIVEYDLIAARSLLTSAAKHREQFLYNRYLMGKRALELGEKEPPFAFLIPPDQTDKPTKTRMIDILLEGGVEVHQAQNSFTADGVPYPSQTYIILMRQPFRAYAKDLLEPQTYPDLRESDEAAPIQPYDVAGWTLPYQMGVKTVKVTNSFDVDMLKVSDISFKQPPLPSSPGYAYTLSHKENNSFIVTNRLLAKGAEVYWMSDESSKEDNSFAPGTIIIPARQSGITRLLRESTSDLSLSVDRMRKAPKGQVYQLHPVRLGMYKPWMSSMHEGWSRWVLEQYEFLYKNILNEELRAGNLRSRYDVIYIPDIWAEGILKGREKGTTPPRFAEGIGDEGLVHLKKFVEEGGFLITMDSSSDLLIGDFGLPVANTLKDMERKDFFCPGSILGMEYDIQHPVAYGMEKESMAFFARSPAFKIIPNFKVEAKAVAKYPDKHILKSGFLLGEKKIASKASVVDIPVGKGHVILIGFDAINRAQAHVTFKLLFNAILWGGATTTQL